MNSRDVSLSELLNRLSIHLNGLAEEVHIIEHVVGNELGQRNISGSETIVRLQRLDFTRQSLEDMARLTQGLSRGHDGRVDMNLAHQLRLDASKLLFSVHLPNAPTNNTHTNAAGDVDLF